MTYDLTPAQREIVDRTGALARGRFAARADGYDRAASFPAEDFVDLRSAGLHAAAVPREYGGLGLGPPDSLLPLWLMTAHLAQADMSLARCWEGHVNAQVLLANLGTDRQRARWFEGIVDRGEKWVAWSGEPRSKLPHQQARFGTHLREVAGGYVLKGAKAFATSAAAAQWAILLVNLHGPGGARHASPAAADGLLLLACDLSDPSVRFDEAWWDPIGMRGTVSYAVQFDDTFLPAENVLGQPGQYLRDRWQSCFSPHYGATFLGGARAAFGYTLECVETQGRQQDPYVQHHIASMELDITSAELWLAHVARLWAVGRTEEARSAGNKARFLLERWATDAVDHALKVCGARSLIRPSLLERVYRDLSFYVRHDNADHVLATIGRERLAVAHDGSFFSPESRPASGPDKPQE